MFGYPGMLLLTAGDIGLPTIVSQEQFKAAMEQTVKANNFTDCYIRAIVTRGGGLAFESVAPTNVTLDPGQAAYFNLGYNDVTQGTTTCSSATQVEITPPNDTSYVVTKVPQIIACGGGALNVSPIFPSTDAPATSTTAPPSA